MTEIPTIETECLTLPACYMADFSAYSDLMTSDRARYMGEPLKTTEAVWGEFCTDIAQWALVGFGAWAIDRKSDHSPIGQVGFGYGPCNPERELGWADCVSYIDPRNARSIALAECMGAIRDDEAEKPSPDVLVYRHKRGLQ